MAHPVLELRPGRRRRRLQRCLAPTLERALELEQARARIRVRTGAWVVHSFPVPTRVLPAAVDLRRPPSRRRLAHRLLRLDVMTQAMSFVSFPA